jgi:hypothetical protein
MILGTTTKAFTDFTGEVSLLKGCSRYETNFNHMTKMAGKVKNLYNKLEPLKTDAAAKAKFCAVMSEKTKKIREKQLRPIKPAKYLKQFLSQLNNPNLRLLPG